MRFIRRFVNALKWNSALDLSANGEFQKALQKADSMDFRNLGVLKADVGILRSYLLMRLNEPEAKKAIAETLTVISEASWIECVDKVYMRKYLEWVLASIYSTRADKGIDYNDVNLPQVSKRLKEIFPLSNHPAWR